VILSDGDPILERELRWMPIYDFNFRILALKKNQAKQTNSLEMEPYGLK
jgi:hypothetical protein